MKEGASGVGRSSGPLVQADVPFSSNEMQLSVRQWGIVLVIVIMMFCLVPTAWEWTESFEPGSDYRIPYDLSNNYWMYNRYCRFVCSQNKALVIGDSVVWGQYVKKEQTLSHYLNELLGEECFANMGVDGLHPAAMAGMLKYYGKAISGKNVILHCNPLWMSSKRHDLQDEKEFRFNHPRLVPQVTPNLACYKPSFTEIVGVVAERNVAFFSWINHLRINYFENLNIPSWTMENPYQNPIGTINFEVPMPENKPKSKPVSWSERAMRKQNLPWVGIKESFQWSYFKKAIEILIWRGNNIFVVLGPFNPYVLTEASLNRYNVIKGKMEKWFEKKRIRHYSVPDLPSEYYADASHPLKEGYLIIAEELLKDKSFQQWMEKLKRR